MKKLSILDGQDIYGTRYPELVKLYQAHEAGAWTEFEVSLSQDTSQYYKLDPVRRSIFENCIRMFTQADKDVCDGYLPLIQYYENNDSRIWFLKASAREVTHQKGYALIPETLGFDDRFFGEFLNYAAMKEKHEAMLLEPPRNPRELALYHFTLAAFEGLSIFAMFAILLYFSERNIFRGIGEITDWSLRDENLHVMGHVWHFKQLMTENLFSINDNFKRQCYDTIRAVVNLECNAIDCVFQSGDFWDLGPEDFKNYVKYMADFRLQQFNLKPNYNVKNPLKFMDKHMSMASEHDFFSTVSGAYARNNLSGSWDDVWGQFDSGSLNYNRGK